MHKQTKYNRKNKELISQKAKDKYDLQRATEEGKAKASLYAKEKQRRYRERLKVHKFTGKFKIRIDASTGRAEKPNFKVIGKYPREVEVLDVIGYEGLYSVGGVGLYGWKRDVKGFKRNTYIDLSDRDENTEVTLYGKDLVGRKFNLFNILSECSNENLEKYTNRFKDHKKQIEERDKREKQKKEVKEQASYPDPTANKESRGGDWNWVKGFEGFYRVCDDNYYGFPGWLLVQERRVNADGNRIKNYKKLTPIAKQKHSRYVKLLDANFKSVYVKWSDIIEHYESINGKSTFNHYEDNINRTKKIKELKDEYNTDGTSKIIQRIELEILKEEKTLGRKLTIDEEMRIESNMKFDIRLEKYV